MVSDDGVSRNCFEGRLWILLQRCQIANRAAKSQLPTFLDGTKSLPAPMKIPGAIVTAMLLAADNSPWGHSFPRLRRGQGPDAAPTKEVVVGASGSTTLAVESTQLATIDSGTLRGAIPINAASAGMLIAVAAPSKAKEAGTSAETVVPAPTILIDLPDDSLSARPGFSETPTVFQAGTFASKTRAAIPLSTQFNEQHSGNVQKAAIVQIHSVYEVSSALDGVGNTSVEGVENIEMSSFPDNLTSPEDGTLPTDERLRLDDWIDVGGTGTRFFENRARHVHAQNIHTFSAMHSQKNWYPWYTTQSSALDVQRARPLQRKRHH